MTRYLVELSQLVRETTYVTVEVPDGEDPEIWLGDLYDVADDVVWTGDNGGWVEQGTHHVVGKAKDTDRTDARLTGAPPHLQWDVIDD